MLAQQGELRWSTPHSLDQVKNIRLTYSMNGIDHQFDLDPITVGYQLEIPANTICTVRLESIGKNGWNSQPFTKVIEVGDLTHPEAPFPPRDIEWTPGLVVERPDPVVDH